MVAVSSLARLLDANANRAREALRVMEDVARFLINHAELAAACKMLRHDLRAALERLPHGHSGGWLEANRDTRGDVGTTITAAREGEREGIADLAAAAGKRLSEALRSLEEAGKIFDPTFARAIEALRYRGYDIERRLTLALGSGRARPWRVCVLLTEALCARPWEDVVKSIIDAGVEAIQVREKTMQAGALLARVRRVIELARPRGVSVIVNDRADIALAAGADGVHVGQEDISVQDVRRLAGRALLVGVSTHNLDEAKRAVEAGADYCGVGAMFETPIKPERMPSGPAYLRAYIEAHGQVPHLAIGGITPETLPQLIAAGARGVAVSACVCGADDPGAVVTLLNKALTAVRADAPSCS